MTDDLIGRPQPDPARFARGELQVAYELGFEQEYEHDSFVLLDRLAIAFDDAGSAVEAAERVAAALDGAADALHALARRRRADLELLRALEPSDDDRGRGGGGW
jgi:hypothetical protein